ncbi:hypothetical protein GUITHDRAFT_113655 [Guillardia theta CCMP2712]|uniref:RING-type domain-containing protein n=2 Tax=Guillardia theta TaxID=55529 RepID=L1IWF8_GUITC|nr:hypothetical protein GUITHDRAFT_113655 [Guillardia theta CCMP2712]EKX40175.1 hypothetical protein GUITHDRAFT_113655 [Guillardia theta CCMP2712]|eukprot:XP_005827155.1 hypothetical protein GUITHDRAFT_113655 [Guillardia theta CCMP2712]
MENQNPASSPTAPKGTMRSRERGTVMKFLDCTVCFDSIAGPVFQCTEGHLLCQTCWSRLNTPDAGCPTCSAVLGRIRCRFAEQIRDALSGLNVASPSRTSSKQLPHVPRLNVLKSASDKIGVNVEDLRSIIARDGVGLMDAVILSARKKIRSDIQDSGGVNAYERKKQHRDSSASEAQGRPERSNAERQQFASPRLTTLRASKDKQEPQVKPKPPEKSMSQESRGQVSQEFGSEVGRKKALRPKGDRGETPPKDVQDMYLKYKETISRSSTNSTRDLKPMPLSARSSIDAGFDYNRFAATVAKYSNLGGPLGSQSENNTDEEDSSDVAAARPRNAGETEGLSSSTSVKEKDIVFRSLQELNGQEGTAEAKDSSILESYKKFRNDMSKQIRSAAHTRPSSSVEFDREEGFQSIEAAAPANDAKQDDSTQAANSPKNPGDGIALFISVEKDKVAGDQQQNSNKNPMKPPSLDLEMEQNKKTRKNVKLLKNGGSQSARSPGNARKFHDSLHAASRTYKDLSPRISILRNHTQALEAIKAGDNSGSAAWNIVANVRRRLRS